LAVAVVLFTAFITLLHLNGRLLRDEGGFKSAVQASLLATEATRMTLPNSGSSLRSFLALALLFLAATSSAAHEPQGNNFLQGDSDLPAGAIFRVGTMQFRHRHDSGQAVFSPDGTVIASASLRYGPAVSKDDGRTGVVECWEAATGRLLNRLPGRKAAFSADGRSLAILDLDAVRVYDWPEPGEKPRAEFTREVRDMVEFALSPNGRNVILIYAVPSERQRDRPDIPPYQWTGRRILAWDSRDEKILWDVARPAGGRSLASKSWNLHYDESSKPRGLTISPDGTLVAVHFVEPDRLFLMETATGRVVRELDDEGWRIATWFSPNGKTLYSAREDLPRPYIKEVPGFSHQALEVWDVASGERRKRIEIPEPLYDWSSVAPSPDGKRLVIGTRLKGAVVGVLNLDTREALWSRPVRGLPEASKSDPIPRFGFSPDGKVVAASLGGFVRQWDAGTGEELPQSRREAPELGRMAFAPDGTFLAVAVDKAGDKRPHVRRLDADTGKELGEYEADFPSRIIAMAVSPDSKWLAACDTKGNVRAWNVATGEVVREFQFENDVQSYLDGFSRESRRQAVAFSPDGRWLLASSAARLHLLDVANGWKEGPTAPIGYDMGALNGGFFLPGSSIFVAAKHKTVRAIDLSGDEPRLAADLTLDRVIYAAAPSPDGKSVRLITGRFNFYDVEHPTVLVQFNTADWKEQRRMELPDSARINAVAYPTDRVMVCGENDGHVTVREAETGEILERHRAHRTGDIQLEALPDGSRWCSVGRTAMVWGSGSQR
jgi:WD40 repeat protein